MTKPGTQRKFLQHPAVLGVLLGCLEPPTRDIKVFQCELQTSVPRTICLVLWKPGPALRLQFAMTLDMTTMASAYMA